MFMKMKVDIAKNRYMLNELSIKRIALSRHVSVMMKIMLKIVNLWYVLLK